MSDKEDLEKLQQQLGKFKKPNSIAFKQRGSKIDSFTIATELVAGVLVGVMTGVFLDKIFDLKPSFLIICLLLGMAGAFKTIWYKIKKD